MTTKRAAIRRSSSEHDVLIKERIVASMLEATSLLSSAPEAALQTFKSLAGQAGTEGLHFLYARLLFFCAEACSRLGRYKKMDRYAARAAEQLKNIESITETATIHTLLGTYYLIRSDLKKAFPHLEKAYELFQQAPGLTEMEARDRAQTLYSLGAAYMHLSDYENALTYYLRALEFARADRNVTATAALSINIGSVYRHMQDLDTAGSYYLDARELYKSIGNESGIAFTVHTLGIIANKRKDYPRALELFDDALPTYQRMGNTQSEASVLYERAEALHHLGESQRALTDLSKATALAEQEGNIGLTGQILFHRGKIYMDLGEIDNACALLLQALEATKKCGMLESQVNIHQTLSALYEQNGDKTEALRHQRFYAELREQIITVERQQAIARLEIEHAREQARKEREMLNMRLELAEKEAAAKRKELHAMALRLARRNELLASLQDTISSISSIADVENAQVRHIASEALSQMRAQMDRGKEWASFEQEFKGLYDEFIHALKTTAPELTPTEIKICVMIRMNLPSKQIADILFCSEETVRTHRRNIRKKLGLRREVNLMAYLLNI